MAQRIRKDWGGGDNVHIYAIKQRTWEHSRKKDLSRGLHSVCRLVEFFLMGFGGMGNAILFLCPVLSITRVSSCLRSVKRNWLTLRQSYSRSQVRNKVKSTHKPVLIDRQVISWIIGPLETWASNYRPEAADLILNKKQETVRAPFFWNVFLKIVRKGARLLTNHITNLDLRSPQTQ